jgi:hypothetical protein
LPEIDAGHPLHAVFRPEPLRLLLHEVDEFRTLDAVRESGEVFHVGGEGQLSAGFVSFENQRGKIPPGRVDGRRRSGAPGTEDNHLVDHDGSSQGMIFMLKCAPRSKALSSRPDIFPLAELSRRLQHPTGKMQ